MIGLSSRPTNDATPWSSPVATRPAFAVSALDETNFPDLAEADDLEIRDVATAIPIYRRGAPFAVQAGAFFRLETQVRPLRAVDAAFERCIASSYAGLERFSLETITQIFCLDRHAIYVSGRVNYRSIEAQLADGFRLATVLQDPYVELAERLIMLRGDASAIDARLGPREAAAFAPAAAFARALDRADSGGLKQAFRHVPHDVAFALGNPLLRQLASHPSSSAVESRSLSAALNLLAQFDVVGLHDSSAVCAEAFGEWCGHAFDESAFAPPSPEVRRAERPSSGEPALR